LGPTLTSHKSNPVRHAHW